MTDAAPPAVRLVSLTKHFGHDRGVSRLDLDVEPRQVFGFLGPNGAGKSTTIRLMMGLYRPAFGRAEVLGVDASQVGPAAEVRRRVGYLPGDLALHPQLTGGETLDRIAGIRGGVDASYRAALVERFGAELARPIRALSKGNRQKIGLVAAFMHRPELLVLDEPTSGLDPLLQRQFAMLLEECVDDGATVFLSSHDLAEVQRLAHRVAIIRDGRIVADDTVEALRARAPRTVELTFRDRVEPAVFGAVPGAELTACSGRRATFRVSGEIGPLLAAALPLGIVDLEAHSADLDDLFLDYYTEEAPGAR
ncbi:MAG TPA: ABC transporter ATP-binding protein [Nocardioides sp.]|nr:ABC transporter ATP-binding protein [Nocardioides sp.]